MSSFTIVRLALVRGLLSITGSGIASARTAYAGNEGDNCGDIPTPGPGCVCFMVFNDGEFECAYCGKGRPGPGNKLCDTDVDCLSW